MSVWIAPAHSCVPDFRRSQRSPQYCSSICPGVTSILGTSPLLRVIVEAERIGHRIDDANVLGQIACLRTEDLAIARNYEAARVQLAAGMVQMQRLHPV